MENNQQKTLNDILETVAFIKDNAASKEDLKGFATKEDLKGLATKEDLKGFATKADFMMVKNDLEERMATKEDLTTAKTEIMTHVDDFITLHRKLETELVSLQSKYKRLEEQLQFLAQHLHVALPE
ncbi:hypothetical protein HY625_00605 [Candidatus Uhrbacteria bacterium]|nr:hypothetical protein [Candidatus Uhrbacteria bacterium]